MLRANWISAMSTPFPARTSTRGQVFPEFFILVVALRFCQAGYESVIGAGGTTCFFYLSSTIICLAIHATKSLCDFFRSRQLSEIGFSPIFFFQALSVTNL